ncbi:hypothetical protein [Paludisphaera mucosa]|uniref:Lipoprotein n=1 Tax=Paludisphaera mucosa TaxID=3030827 RepID=A0ABT6FJT7_9BACT|nr:hypothetical protein [Paludisphaera mucosa]MDG3007845.1 hypothetical protein [Paludisphaera mucosa]
MTRLRRISLAAMFSTGLAATAEACPVCSRPAGRAVRAGIFDGGFGLNLLAAALPFGVCLGVAAAVHFAPDGGRER